MEKNESKMIIYYIESLFSNFFNQINKFQIKQDLICWIHNKFSNYFKKKYEI